MVRRVGNTQRSPALHPAHPAPASQHIAAYSCPASGGGGGAGRAVSKRAERRAVALLIHDPSPVLRFPATATGCRPSSGRRRRRATRATPTPNRRLSPSRSASSPSCAPRWSPTWPTPTPTPTALPSRADADHRLINSRSFPSSPQHLRNSWPCCPRFILSWTVDLFLSALYSFLIKW